jgi:hypothetical protein
MVTKVSEEHIASIRRLDVSEIEGVAYYRGRRKMYNVGEA